VAEAFATGFLSPTFADVISLVFLLVVLLIRPRGLLGARLVQKV
jgi:branched-subunit amino acid ABC-type transport system permease component